MPGACAYVRFLEDNENLIVKQHDIKNFNENDLGKKYNVKYEDGHYYPACVLLLGSSEKELQKKIDKGPRLKYPPVHLLQSATEEEEEDERRFKYKQKNSSEKYDCQSKDVPKKKKKNTANNDNYKNIENYNDLIASSATEKCVTKCVSVTSCEKCSKHIQELKEEIKQLRELNRKLQVTVIDDWKALSAQIKMANSGDGVKQGVEIDKSVVAEQNVGCRSGDRIHLGRNVWISTTMYDSICFKSKDKMSIFVKNLASVIFGDKTLSTSSVTGVACNRIKGNAKPQLDPTKLMALKDIVNYKMRQEPGVTAQEINKTLAAVNKFVAQKIVDLMRIRPKKLVEVEETAEEQVEQQEQNTLVSHDESDNDTINDLATEMRKAKEVLENEEWNE